MLEICDGNEGHRLVFGKVSNPPAGSGDGGGHFFNYAAALIR